MAESNTLDGAAEVVPQLRIARYRLRFRATGAAPAGYLGSAWRGAFGHALRRQVCVMGLPPSCDGCPLLASCVYPRTFESRPPTNTKKLRRYPTTPNPYILEPAGEADRMEDAISLGVTLFGPANNDAPTVLHALEAAGQDGLTSARVSLDLAETEVERHGDSGSAWASLQDSRGCNLVASTIAVPPAPSRVRVRLLSPLRVRRGGSYARLHTFDFRTFAANLLRRLSLLTYFYGEAPLELNFAALVRIAEGIALEDVQLRWRELSRRSSRQGAVIPMGGLLGAFTVRSPALPSFWPCLWLGQWTHIGKGCTMGLGQYALEPLDAVAAGCWWGPAPLGAS